MGGEPTFVSIDDRDAPSGTPPRSGRPSAGSPIGCCAGCAARFAPGGLLHHGQGKWYPGEPLPRWAYSCYFRRDGEPIWHEPALFAKERPTDADRSERSERPTGSSARWPRRLGVDDAFAQPAYEDVFYYLWRERRLPVNVDVLEDAPRRSGRARPARRVFGAGLGSVVGYVLPLRAHEHRRPASLGERPLARARRAHVPDPGRFADGLPAAARHPAVGARGRARPGSTSAIRCAPRPPLPKIVRQTRDRQGRMSRVRRTACPTSAASLVRTALCVEARDGILHVFMPPVGFARGVPRRWSPPSRTSRASCEQPVRLEGYTPPNDHRLERFSVTPDPGVIEVNIHPARSWRELVENTTALYEEARALPAGRPRSSCSTVATPAPAAATTWCWAARRRPTARSCAAPICCAACIGYWLNHPSLSYLFSGLFVGPTSQAPRIDEARQDSLHELELAFAQVPLEGHRAAVAGRSHLPQPAGRRHRQHPPHRALHRQALQPGRARAGAWGLVELRAFEMPPHARMSLTQQLLLRALVAWFWRQPYRQKLVRWGTGLRRQLHAAALRRPGLRRRARRPAHGRVRLFARVVPRPQGVPVPAGRRDRHAGAGAGAAARPSSRGTCWARSRGAAVPPATSIRRSSAWR